MRALSLGLYAPLCMPHTRRFRRKHLRSLDASSPRSFTCPLLHGLTLETALTCSLPNRRRLYGGCRFVRSLRQTAVSVRPACRGQKLRRTCLIVRFDVFSRAPLLIRRKAHTGRGTSTPGRGTQRLQGGEESFGLFWAFRLHDDFIERVLVSLFLILTLLN